MTSQKQIEANRRNAQKSTGPNSPAGRARSKLNALKHGLTAEQVVITGEDPAAFEALRDDLYAHYQPADPVAEHLVEQVAATTGWEPAPDNRHLLRHLNWLVRFQIKGETVDAIAWGDQVARRSVERAIAKTASAIGLTRRSVRQP